MLATGKTATNATGEPDGASKNRTTVRPVPRVLVIDDDSFVCQTMAALLGKLGVTQVVTVSDGPQAVHLLNESAPFDLIISDLALPKVDGIQLMRMIAARQQQAAVLYMSSAGRKLLDAAETLAGGRGLRVLGAVEKPVTLEHLRRYLAILDEVPRRAARQREGYEASPADLRKAIENEEIKVYVQPQLLARSGDLHGVEALARWVSPTRGVIPPDCFIGVAERNGLIDQITELMVSRSIAACGAWRRAGLKIRISVNTPVSSLSALSMPDIISEASQRRGMETEQLTLEVTESGLMRDAVRSLDVLTRLRLRNVGLAIDDFGCGYSSLQQLKRMPFDELKIDCSFVMAMLDNAESRSIVKSSIDLARGLGLRTVAEGVESLAHWQALAQMHCDVVQGYYIARPFPVEQLPAWWAQHAPQFRREIKAG